MPWISLHGAAVTAQSLMGEVTLTPSPFDFRQLINLAHKDQRPDKGMNPAMHNCITSHVPDCPPWKPRTAAEPSTYYRTPNSHTHHRRPRRRHRNKNGPQAKTHPPKEPNAVAYTRGCPDITVPGNMPNSVSSCTSGLGRCKRGVRGEIRSKQKSNVRKQREATRAAEHINIAMEPRVCKEIHTQGPAPPS